MDEISVLVLTEDYPDNEGRVALNYVHTRNIRYGMDGITVDDLSFSAEKSYNIDGIRVLSMKDYKASRKKYDILLLHAPNLRHHYRFLRKYGDRFKHFVFFFHGHEVMRINKDYSRPYSYIKKNIVTEQMQNLYDEYKLKTWRRYFPTIIDKSSFVFVSEWMKNIFEKNVGISCESLTNRCYITYNSVGSVFETQSYDPASEKKYDFVTIRSNLDGSKYAVDIVNTIAAKTPEGKFAVVGKGELFDHIEKAKNIDWLNKTMSHDEIISILNQSRYALMPTRTDAQGLMMCEMAAFGIPVITSDIDVCHEVFDGFENASFISNEDPEPLESYLSKDSRCVKDKRFLCSETTRKEIDMLKEIYNLPG